MKAAQAVEARALALMQSAGGLGIATEQFRYPADKKPACVLVAIAREGLGSIVLAIDASEFDHAAQLELAVSGGAAALPTAMERAVLQPQPSRR